MPRLLLPLAVLCWPRFRHRDYSRRGRRPGHSRARGFRSLALRRRRAGARHLFDDHRRPGPRGRGRAGLRQDPARRRRRRPGRPRHAVFRLARQRRPRHVLRRARSDLHGRQRRACGCAIAMATAAADGEPEIWTQLRHPEHGANGIVRGPDGCFYLVCGNDAGISAEHAALATSPVKQPRSRRQSCASRADGKPLDILRPRFSQSLRSRLRRRGPPAHGRLRRRARPSPALVRADAAVRRRPGRWSTAGCSRAGPQSWNRPESFFDNVERIGRNRPRLADRRGRLSASSSFPSIIAAACSPPAGRLAASITFRSKRPGPRAAAPLGNVHGNDRRRRLCPLRSGRRARRAICSSPSAAGAPGAACFACSYHGRSSHGRPADDPLEQVLAADQPLTQLVARTLGAGRTHARARQQLQRR